MKKDPLSAKRRKWLKERKIKRVVGNPVLPNACVRIKYANELLNALKPLFESYRNHLLDYLGYGKITFDSTDDREFKYTKDFDKLLSDINKSFSVSFEMQASILARSFVQGATSETIKRADIAFKNLGGEEMLTITAPKLNVSKTVKRAVKDNIALIKSIPLSFHKRLRRILRKNAKSGGLDSAKLFRAIQETKTITKKRAVLIARDQTKKLNAVVTRDRFLDLGVTEFKWVHTKAGKTFRSLHVSYNGKIFSLANPPVIDEKTGERGLPAQLINCHCQMRPVIDRVN